MELYNYNNENNNIDFEIKIDLHKDEGIADNLRKFILIYESPYNSPIEINNNIYAELFIKDNFFIKPVNFASETFEESSKNLIVNNFKYFNKNIPLLIFLHGFSTKDEKLKNYYKFISSITNSDIACLFINLPFHLNRRPVNEASGERLIYYDDVDTLLFFHQCVVDIKKSIDIINNILSPSEINICGISLGSMVSVIAMAVDNRIDKGILILGGGNWEEIHWNGILKFILKGNCAGDEKIIFNE